MARNIGGIYLMAIIPANEYVNTNPASAPYPYGSAKNVSNPVSGTDGTPLEEKWMNDWFGFAAALLKKSGIVPSGSPDQVGNSDYLEAVKKIIASQVNLVGVISGLETIQDPTNVNNITINPGYAGAQQLDGEIIKLEAPISKNLVIEWQEGNGGGRFSQEPVNNESWHLFVIKNTTTGAVDAGFSQDVLAGDIPTGYDAYARVASFRLLNAAIPKYIQDGDHFHLKERRLLISTSARSFASNIDSFVPVKINATALMYLAVRIFSNTVGASGATLTIGVNDLIAPARDWVIGNAGGPAAQRLEIPIPSTGLFRIKYNTTGKYNGGFNINLFGWIDSRGRY